MDGIGINADVADADSDGITGGRARLTVGGLLPLTDVPLADLRPHPRNYRGHTEVQLAHLVQSVTEHGLYRPVVVARDNVILAGHGLVEACRQLQWLTISVVRVDLDPFDVQALKLLIGDNQIAQGADIDDRALTETLKEISELADLLGTGYDTQQLLALAMVTRPAHELEDANAAAEWAGLPDAGTLPTKPLQVMVHCATEEDRQAFFAAIGATSVHIFGTTATRSMWYPLRERRSEAPRFLG